MDTNYNRIKVSDLEKNEPNKILITNENGELEFNDVKSDTYNGLDYIQEGKPLDARQGKVLKDLIDGFILQAPHFLEAIPNNFLPNSTGNIIIKGSFFTPSTTIIIENQSINYIEFKNDNEIHINVTTNNTEGLFDIIINNGISKTYQKRFSIILGTIHDSLESDWTGILNIDVTGKGSALCVGDSVTALGTWKKEIDIYKNFSVRFNIPFSPLSIRGIDSFIRFKDVVTNEVKVYFEDYGRFEGSPNRIYYGWNGGQYGYLEIDRNKYLELRKIGNIVNLYANSGEILIATISNLVTFPNNLQLSLSLNNSDLKNLKYIELFS